MEDSHRLRDRLIASALLVVIIISLSLMPARWFGLASPDTTRPTLGLVVTGTGSKLSYDVTADSNNDGVPDWKETIIGSSDVSGEGNTLTPEEQKVLDDPNNLTVALAKNNTVIGSYINQNQGIGSSTIDSISADSIKAAIDKLTVNQKNLEDIHVSKDLTSKDLKNLGNNLSEKTTRLLIVYATSSDLGDLEIISSENATESDKASAQRRLTAKAHDVHALADYLLGVSVIPDARIVHLAYINSLLVYSDLLIAFAQAELDPLKAGIFAQIYSETFTRLKYSFLSYSDIFQKHAILFTKKDYGYVFTSGLLPNK